MMTTASRSLCSLTAAPKGLAGSRVSVRSALKSNRGLARVSRRSFAFQVRAEETTETVTAETTTETVATMEAVGVPEIPMEAPIPVPEPEPVVFCAGLPGASAPCGDNWDPLRAISNQSEDVIRAYRESELIHCRVAMLAFLGIAVGEKWHPLFGGEIGGTAVDQFMAFPPALYGGFFVLAMFAEQLRVDRAFSAESATAETAFMSQDEVVWQSSYRADYVHGDLGWDPLGVKPTDDAEMRKMQTKELNNGRLAMFGVMGILAEEANTGVSFYDKFLVAQPWMNNDDMFSVAAQLTK